MSVVNDEGGIQSHPLVIDTHKAASATIIPDTSSESSTDLSSSSYTSSQPTLFTSSETSAPLVARNVNPPHTTASEDSVALAVAGVTTLVMLLVLVSSWRCRHRLALPHSQLVVEDEQSPSLYRGRRCCWWDLLKTTLTDSFIEHILVGFTPTVHDILQLILKLF